MGSAHCATGGDPNYSTATSKGEDGELMRKDSLALLTFCPFVPCLVLKTLRFDGLGTLFCSREAPGYLTDVHLTIAGCRPPSFFGLLRRRQTRAFWDGCASDAIREYLASSFMTSQLPGIHVAVTRHGDETLATTCDNRYPFTTSGKPV